MDTTTAIISFLLFFSKKNFVDEETCENFSHEGLIQKVNLSYRLLNRDEIFEKKLVRPVCGDSAAPPPVPV